MWSSIEYCTLLPIRWDYPFEATYSVTLGADALDTEFKVRCRALQACVRTVDTRAELGAPLACSPFTCMAGFSGRGDRTLHRFYLRR